MRKLFTLFALLPFMAVNSYCQYAKLGDVNLDGDVDISDVVFLVNKILNPDYGNLTCPDDHHPHVIDLGLPSGTKWSCCNMGSSAPEDFGGYYAWGETEEKETYNWSTYIHCEGTQNTCKDIGSNIRGTEYDVVRQDWGNAWLMPSQEQINELFNTCTSEWTEVNGVKGCKLTAPNGGSIFLPAAGYKTTALVSQGSLGRYWSANVNPNTKHWAYYFQVGSNNNFWGGKYSTNRCEGHSIRPVATRVPATLLGDVNDDGYIDISDVVFLVNLILNPNATNLTCPDNHHPHLIDLGLPSGTKWACCNVGAVAPDAYGGYYAWGETEEKETYNWANYSLCEGTQSTCFKIYDICGTEYDVATKEWGEDWVMPTQQQMKELLENCSYEWTELYETKGYKLKGPSGGSIFLPAAGYKTTALYSQGSLLHYWSGTGSFNTRYWAYPLYSYSSTLYWKSGHNRCEGKSVRPVLKAEESSE